MATLQARLDKLEAAIHPRPLKCISWNEEISYFEVDTTDRVDYRACLGIGPDVIPLTQAQVNEYEKRYTLFVTHFEGMKGLSTHDNYTGEA